MSYGRITTETMTDIADAIRDKTGSEAQVTPTQMPERIRSIQTGNPNAVLYIEQELTEEEKAQARDNIGAVGEDDIPTVPQLATEPDMTDWTSGKTVDAAVLKNGVQYIERMIAGKADASDIPTAVSELTNDSGYQTAQDVQTAVSGVRQLPTGGTTGDFLRKDSNGNAAWETLSSYQGGSY